MSLNHTISRRAVFKGGGAVAAASALGAGAVLGAAPPAHAAGLEVVNEDTVLTTQREFAAALDSAGITYESFEEQGGHFVRPERLQQDVDRVVAHLRKAE